MSTTFPSVGPEAVKGAPRVSPRCAWQVVDGEAVLLDLTGKRLVGLNAVGSYVLPLVDGRHTVAELAASVAERFGVEASRAEVDVAAFLRDLARRGFVDGIEPGWDIQSGRRTRSSRTGGRTGGMTGGTMGTSETKGRESSPPTVAAAPAPVVYEPPAVAWEETFDPVAQTASDCETNPAAC